MSNQKTMKKSIISILGLESMPIQDQVEIVTQVMDLVNSRIMLRIAENLDDETVDAYEKMVKEGDENQLPQFISQYIPDFYDMMEEEIHKVKEDLAGMVEEIEP